MACLRKSTADSGRRFSNRALPHSYSYIYGRWLDFCAVHKTTARNTASRNLFLHIGTNSGYLAWGKAPSVH
eukprot:scaffold482160_cov24-Prasinocladus_malaysianus.AAC.1